MNQSYQTRLGGAHSCAVWYSEVKVISRLTKLKNDDRQRQTSKELFYKWDKD